MPSGRWRALGYANTGVQAILPLGPHGDTLVGGGAGGTTRFQSVDGGVTMNYWEGSGPSRAGAIIEMPSGHPNAGRIAFGSGSYYSDDRGRTSRDAVGPSINGLRPSVFEFALLPSGRLLYGSEGVALVLGAGAPAALRRLRLGVQAITAAATPGSVQAAGAGGAAAACGLANAVLCEGAIAVGFDVNDPDLSAWRTSDGGRTWSERAVLGQPDDGVGYGYVAGVVDGGPGADGLGRALTVLGRGVIYVTVDGGQTWTSAGRMPMSLDGLEFARYVLLGPDNHVWVVMATIQRGPNRVLRSNEPVTAGFAVASEGAPETVGAHIEVFPNPGRERMTVRVSTPEASAGTSVTVVDALGRVVAVLHDGPLGAGEQTFAVDVSGWPAGAYVVHADVGGARVSARLVVAR